MKKMLVIGSVCAVMLSLGSCSDNQSKQGTHTHEDGSTHTDHDTTKPNQQEFNLGDSAHPDTLAKPHTHKDGETHSH